MENLDKERNQLVVKDNDLIQKARFSLTVTQQRFVAYIVSKIKPEDKDFKTYEIRVKDFCEVCGIDKNHFYDEFKGMIDDLDQNKSFWVDTDTELYKFRWFDETSYQKHKGTIRVTLSARLKTYLLGLSEHFTQYELFNILALRGKYAIRLFELFKSYEYQSEKEFDVEYLKELLLATQYENFNDFRKRVLTPALREINKYTELEVLCEEIRKGRGGKVVRIKFIIEKKDALGRYEAYRQTVNRIDNNIEGQIDMFEYESTLQNNK